MKKSAANQSTSIRTLDMKVGVPCSIHLEVIEVSPWLWTDEKGTKKWGAKGQIGDEFGCVYFFCKRKENNENQQLAPGLKIAIQKAILVEKWRKASSIPLGCMKLNVYPKIELEFEKWSIFHEEFLPQNSTNFTSRKNLFPKLTLEKEEDKPITRVKSSFMFKTMNRPKTTLQQYQTQNQRNNKKSKFDQFLSFDKENFKSQASIQKASIQEPLNNNSSQVNQIPQQYIDEFKIKPRTSHTINIKELSNDDDCFKPCHANDIPSTEKAIALKGLQKLIQTTTSMNCVVVDSNSNSNLSSLLASTLLGSEASHTQDCRLRIVDEKLTYEKINESKQSMQKFLNDLTESLSKAHNVPKERIRIGNISKGSILVHYNIVLDHLNDAVELYCRDNIDYLRETVQENMSVTHVEHSYEQKTYLLNLADFDERGSMEFEEGGTYKRGGLPYYMPKAPWIRVGLAVKNKFENNLWLNMDGNPDEWAVAFHGVREKTGRVINKIALEGMKVGVNNVYENDICQRTQTRVGRGVYCSQYIDIAEGFTEPVQVEDKEYIFIFQCRVRPSAIKSANDGKYWIINNPRDIRPYGLLYKEV